MNVNSEIHFHQVIGSQWTEKRGYPIEESSVSLTVNGESWLSFMCTPENQAALAVGFLYNEGLISSITEVADIRVCEHGDNVDVWLTHKVQKPGFWRKTSGCTGGITSIENLYGVLNPVLETSYEILPEAIYHLMGLLLESQNLYRETGGIHTSGLSDSKSIILTIEDIGRHNTIDKITGLYLLKNFDISPRILLTTGRVSSDMLQKSARFGAGMVISRTAASSMAIHIAQELGVTLIGYARRDRCLVYTHPQRISRNIG